MSEYEHVPMKIVGTRATIRPEELDALRKDAERYRWLRARIPGGTYRVMGVIYSEGGPGVDAAIDAAMAGEGKAA